MRLRTVTWIVAALCAVPLLCVAAVWLLLNTAPGAAFVAELVWSATDGQVSIRGLSGSLPDAPRVAEIEVRDAKGVWLRVENASVKWSAFAFLHDRIQVHRASAERVEILRKPESQGGKGKTPRIDVDVIKVARLDIDRSVVGVAAALSVQGAIHYVSREQVAVDLIARRLDRPGTYRAAGRLRDHAINGELAILEPAGGLLALMAGLPGVGPVELDAHAAGPASANSVSATFTGNGVHANASGTVDLQNKTTSLQFSGGSGALQLRPDLRWGALAVEGRLSGSFDKPNVLARLEIDGASGGEATLQRLMAEAVGRGGHLSVKGRAFGFHLPGGQLANVFSASPFTFDGEGDLVSGKHPVTLTLSHRLLRIAGRATFGASPTIAMNVEVPDLGPLAAMADVQGSAVANIDARFAGSRAKIAAKGQIRATGAGSMTARLLGSNARFALEAAADRADVTSAQVEFKGAGAQARLAGSMLAGKLNAQWTVALPDLARLTPTLLGNLTVQGGVKGPIDTAAVVATGKGSIASKGFRKEPIAIDFRTRGLTAFANATLRATGRFDAAPVTVDAVLSDKDGAHLARFNLGWKSLSSRGNLAWRNGKAIEGPVSIKLARLADLQSLIGEKLSGSLEADVQLAANAAHTLMRLKAQGRALSLREVKADQVTLSGSITDWTSKPVPTLQLQANGVVAQGFSGSVAGDARGPANAIAVNIRSVLHGPDGEPAHVVLAGLLDSEKKQLRVRQFDALAYGERARLIAPASLDFARGIAVDRVEARLGAGTVIWTGRLSPTLATDVSVRGVPLDMLKPWLPAPVEGTLSASAHLTGTLATPSGSLVVEGRDIALRGVSSHVVAPADLNAHALLSNGVAHVDARLASGNATQLALNGTAALSAMGRIDVRATGRGDLAILDPLLTPGGQSVRGKLALDMRVQGTRAAPRASGFASLSDGDIQDYARGVAVRAISATLAADGHLLVLRQLSGKAGQGTITGTGHIDIAAPGLPVDINIALKNAKPLTSDRINAVLDGNISVKGRPQQRLDMAGTIHVTRGVIDIPDKLPTDVATIEVRRPGQRPPSAAPSVAIVNLDLTIVSPGQLYVRGRGLDAELEGRMHLTGTTSQLQVDGALNMRRGSISVAGQTLDFTSGKVSFDGASLKNRIDPTLDFTAQSSSGSVIATLQVTGHVSAPKITLSSTPQLPQDEVLARLFFQQSASQLSPVQLAEIGAAVAALGGFGSSLDPVAWVRKSLGLDRLAVGSVQTLTSTQTQTTLEAGKYVMHNVYVGARQNLSGGTQAKVQIDITKHLKAQAMLGTGTNATVTQGGQLQDNGSGAGLSYQFEY